MLDGQVQLTGAANAPIAKAYAGREILVAMVLGLVVLSGCATKKNSRAPVVDLSGQSQTQPLSATPGSTYVVKPGDTLFKIARSYNLDVDSLARWNNVADPGQIRVGQVLQLSSSGGSHARPPASASTQSEPIKTSGTPQPQPLDGSASSVAEPAKPAAAPDKPAPQRAADAGLINWTWPASGTIIQSFNANSKGIDIGGTAGDPVHAAADGKVMYSGNSVRGLGNLIIINHDNGFLTAYAHNRSLLVKTGQNVKRGAKIAEIGQTDAPSPRLHFEIRRQGTPVDPLQYLPPK